MTTLRSILGLTTALVTTGWVALAILGGGFRRSFGASEKSPLLSFVPMVSAALVIASIIWPDRRGLLHVVAVLMLPSGVGCLVLARETVFVASLGLVYVAVWFAFHYRGAWAPAASVVGAP